MHYDTDQFMQKVARTEARSSADYRTAHELAAKLFALTNSMSDTTLGIAVADAFNQEHRTLQQSAIRNIIKPVLMVLDWNGDTGAFDLRNEGSVRWAQAALEATESKGLPLV